MATNQIQYFNGMLDSNNEVKINDFYPYFMNYEFGNPSYNKVGFNSKFTSRVGDNYTERITEKSEDMLFAAKKRLGFDRMFWFDQDGNDISYIFDKPTIDCETSEPIPIPEVTGRIDEGAYVTDHEWLDGELFVMVRGKKGHARYIFKLTNYNASNECGELINPEYCKGKLVLRGTNNCDLSNGIYPDDNCINDKFVKFMGPKGKKNELFSGKILYQNEEGVEGRYIPCKAGISPGDVVYLNQAGSVSTLSGQWTTSTGNTTKYKGRQYCEIVEPLGGNTLATTGFLPGSYQFEGFDGVGEVLAFTTGNGLEYITYSGEEPGEMETIQDATFYKNVCPIDQGDKKWRITGLNQTPWGGLVVKHTDSPYAIYGANGSTGQAYFLNATYVGREYTTMHNVYDHIILLGQTTIGSLSPSYDGNGSFTGAKHILIDDNIGYYSKTSYDVGMGSLTMFTNHKYFIRIRFTSGYNNQLQYEYTRFFMYDDLVSNISSPDRVYLHDNGGSTIVSVMSHNNTMMYHYDQKHNTRYMWIIEGAEISGIKNSVRFGNGIFCRTCTKKDFGKHFKTLIRAKHGHRALFSLHNMIKLKILLGEGSRIVKGKNILSLYIQAGGEEWDRHLDSFYKSERSKRMMKVKNTEDNSEEDFLKLGSGRCIKKGDVNKNNCEGHQSSFDFMQSFLCHKVDLEECSRFESQSKLGGIGMLEFPISKMCNFMVRELKTEDEAEFEFFGSQRSFFYPSTEITSMGNTLGTNTGLS